MVEAAAEDNRQKREDLCYHTAPAEHQLSLPSYIKT